MYEWCRLSFSERQLSLNQWYIRNYGVSTVVPYVPVPAPVRRFHPRKCDYS